MKGDLDKIVAFAKQKGLGPDPIDIVYFGSDALHYMHLGDANPYDVEREKQALHFEENIGISVNLVRSIKALPVFQTVHSVCTKVFNGKYGVANQPDFPEIIDKYCSKLSEGDAARKARCKGFTLTLEGADFALKLERKSLASAPAPAMDVVDSHSITTDQCWATSSMDGRHYPPLLPVEIRELSDIVRKHSENGTFS